MANIKCEKRLDMKFDCKLLMLTLMTFAKNNCWSWNVLSRIVL